MSEHEVPRNTLGRDAWFGSLPEALRDALLAAGRVKRLRDGAVLHARGDSAEGLYVLLRGAIRISGASEQGRSATLTYIEPGTWFGEISLIDGAPRTHEARAVGEAELLCVPAAEFRGLLTRHPEFGLHLARLLAGKLRQTMAWVEDMSVQPLAARLAQRLLDLHDHQALGAAGQVSLSQDELAGLVGASRQSVNRELKGWEAQGWIVQRYGRLRILDAAALRSVAQGEPGA